MLIFNETFCIQICQQVERTGQDSKTRPNPCLDETPLDNWTDAELAVDPFMFN